VLWVGFGGFLGAVLRYALGQVAARLGGGWPLGTLLVNVLGCLAGGLLLFAIEQEAVSPRARAFLGVGVLGALTTFSTFGVETLVLARASGMGAALGNVALHLALGLGGVAAGYALAGALAD
jgi:CrcB protein